ncbi:glycosyltransferase [Flavobacteriaceae bacterium]|nr:glycosyltransferase [Flavobacteriaceae bacterium]
MKITFFFPDKKIGGVSILFANLANYISLNFDYIEIFIIDYEGGALWKNIKSDLVKKIPFIDGKDCFPTQDSYLVMQSIVLNTIKSELKISQDQKILFWHLHPYNYQINNLFKINFIDKIINKFRLLEKKKIKESIQIIDKFNGLIFMDGSNFEKTINSYHLKIKENYLPITNFKQNLSSVKINLENTNEINLSFIGRLTAFKYYPLIKLLKTINKFVLKNIASPKINFFIIGTGEYENSLIKEIKKLNFQVNLLGEINYSDLSNIFFIHNININFSMGTAALDSSCLGIPTVVLDYSYVEIDGYPNYKWIYNEKKYSLAKELNKSKLTVNNEFSFNKLIEEFIDSYEKISKKTLDYYNHNYGINSVSNLLIKSLEKDHLIFNKIEKYSKKSLLRKTYEKHKKN